MTVQVETDGFTLIADAYRRELGRDFENDERPATSPQAACEYRDELPKQQSTIAT